MRWLHLTDIHMGRPGPTEQNVALGELLRALPAVLAGNPVDAIRVSAPGGRASRSAAPRAVQVKLLAAVPAPGLHLERGRSNRDSEPPGPTRSVALLKQRGHDVSELCEEHEP